MNYKEQENEEGIRTLLLFRSPEPRNDGTNLHTMCLEEYMRMV